LNCPDPSAATVTTGFVSAANPVPTINPTATRTQTFISSIP